MKSSDAHEKNCNISCQPKILSSRTFFAVKVNRTDVNPRICAEVFKSTDSLFDVIYPSTFTAKKSRKMNFSADKIYCNVSHEYPKTSNTVNLRI